MKFKRFDLVNTPIGRMAIQNDYGRIKSEGQPWKQRYICCKLNKDGKTIDSRSLDKRTNSVKYVFTEDQLSFIVDKEKGE